MRGCLPALKQQVTKRKKKEEKTLECVLSLTSDHQSTISFLSLLLRERALCRYCSKCLGAASTEYLSCAFFLGPLTSPWLVIVDS